MINLSNLEIGYGNTAIAPPINASLGGAMLCCLLGGNGTGKSTLIRTLAGFHPPVAGELRLNGQSISTLSTAQQSRLVSVVLTDRIGVQGLRVHEVIEMGRIPYTGYFGRLRACDHEAVSISAAAVGMTAFMNRPISTLSDGEQQKVMIAKALAQETPIILMDEPTAFLDFPSKIETMLLLRRLCQEQGKTVLLSTHDLELALQTAQNLWLMDRQKRMFQGTPQKLAQDGSLAACFESENLIFDKDSLRLHII